MLVFCHDKTLFSVIFFFQTCGSHALFSFTPDHQVNSSSSGMFER